MNTFTALVLAGSRQGGDAFAAEAGATHKALIEVGGVTMIERVVRALEAVPEVDRIVIAMDRPQMLGGLPSLSQNSKPIITFEPKTKPSATSAAALERFGTPPK
jgi:2-C-methyl-D-erythritol 4-phosphate cytidylyltransferase